MTPFRTLLDTSAPDATILVRILVGAVFLSEGIQKFLFSAELGVGRFEKIGIPRHSPLPSWAASRLSAAHF
jgi:putative oxidoreductase